MAARPPRMKGVTARMVATSVGPRSARRGSRRTSPGTPTPSSWRGPPTRRGSALATARPSRGGGRRAASSPSAPQHDDAHPRVEDGAEHQQSASPAHRDELDRGVEQHELEVTASFRPGATSEPRITIARVRPVRGEYRRERHDQRLPRDQEGQGREQAGDEFRPDGVERAEEQCLPGPTTHQAPRASTVITDVAMTPEPSASPASRRIGAKRDRQRHPERAMPGGRAPARSRMRTHRTGSCSARVRAPPASPAHQRREQGRCEDRPEPRSCGAMSASSGCHGAGVVTGRRPGRSRPTVQDLVCRLVVDQDGVRHLVRRDMAPWRRAAGPAAHRVLALARKQIARSVQDQHQIRGCRKAPSRRVLADRRGSRAAACRPARRRRSGRRRPQRRAGPRATRPQSGSARSTRRCVYVTAARSSDSRPPVRRRGSRGGTPATAAGISPPAIPRR